MRKVTLLLILTAALLSVSASAATVAYWRFEEGPAWAQVPKPAPTGFNWYPSVLDSSGSGNELSVWDEGGAGFVFRDIVPSAQVPQYATLNSFSIKNSGGGPAAFTDTNDPINTMTPLQWTIEATFKMENGGHRTIVGRDGHNINNAGANIDSGNAALFFQAIPDNGLAVKFTDVSGYFYTAVSATGVFESFDFNSSNDGVGVPFYSMAATSDGTWLRLYLFNHDQPGNGYVLIAETDMSVQNPGSPDRSLSNGAGGGDGGDWNPGDFSVGRGMWNGGHADRTYGFIDEVRISDKALTPDEFLMSPGYVATVGPVADEYLDSPAAITYEWTTDESLVTANDIEFDHYSIYITNNLTDMGGETPATWLHAADISDLSAREYSGYTGTYDYNEDYYWRVDMVAMDPNYAVPDPNFPAYDIPHVYQGLPVRFFGPRACPEVSISGNVVITPDLISQEYAAEDAVFTAAITRGSVDVDAISWFKVAGVKDDPANPDPNDVPDIEIQHVPGVTEIAFDPTLATAGETTLTIVAADPADNGDYYAYVRLVDPLGGGTGCWETSPAANLFVRDDANAATNYLVHRYGFDSDATDSIGGAHGVIADLDAANHAFADGQIQLTNTGLSSGPRESVEVEDPENPGQMITLDKLLDQEGAYIDLPNGIISSLGKTGTIMTWFTYNSADTGNWPRLFDLGTSTGGEGFATGADGVRWIAGVPYVDGSVEESHEYFMMSPKRDGGPGWRYETVVRPGNPVSAVIDPSNNADIASGQEACLACVFDGARGVMTVYVNGVQVGQRTGVYQDLSNINDVNNWIGRSQWDDAMFTGKINEFRIYDIPLSAGWVEAYYEQGPDDYTTKPNPCIVERSDMDFNKDCVVDMQDFAAFALEWLNCGRLYGCN